MKKIKKLLLSLIILTIAFQVISCTEAEQNAETDMTEVDTESPETAPEPEPVGYAEIYQQFLNTYSYSLSDKETGEAKEIPRFALCWIDEDDVPELVLYDNLILFDGDWPPVTYTGYDLSIWTIIDGSVIKAMDYIWNMPSPYNGTGNDIFYFPYKNQIVVSSQSVSDSAHDIYKIADGRTVLYERGYSAYGNTSGMFYAGLTQNGVERSVYAETVDSEEYAAYLELQSEVIAWSNKIYENAETLTLFSSLTKLPIDTENGVSEYFTAAAETQEAQS